MNQAFWHERWAAGEIGFHQDQVNPYLQRFWHRAGATTGAGVFVPLCGKSRDMLWLAAQGHRVVGVEIVSMAVKAFFAENALSPLQREQGRFTIWGYDGLTIFEGDFFDLRAADVGNISAAYDRASLVAMPPALRPRYARHLASILPPETAVLLIAMEYPDGEMDGPPFSVTEQQVRALYQGEFQVSRLHGEDVLAQNQRFRERGLTRLEEKVYLLVRR